MILFGVGYLTKNSWIICFTCFELVWFNICGKFKGNYYALLCNIWAISMDRKRISPESSDEAMLEEHTFSRSFSKIWNVWRFFWFCTPNFHRSRPRNFPQRFFRDILVPQIYWFFPRILSIIVDSKDHFRLSKGRNLGNNLSNEFYIGWYPKNVRWNLNFYVFLFLSDYFFNFIFTFRAFALGIFHLQKFNLIGSSWNSLIPNFDNKMCQYCKWMSSV
jgi:hypothetical protein